MLRNTGITYFTVPNCFLTIGFTQKITKIETLLYLFLWKQSQHNSTLTLTFSGKALALQTGIAESQVNSARQGLVALGLVQVDRVQGGYEYSLTDPDSGDCISNPRLQSKGFDLRKMTPDEREIYFTKRLQDHGISNVSRTANGLKSCCPFCHGERLTFEVNLSGGVFHCHKCSKRGRIVHFERGLALTMGLIITVKEAAKRAYEHLRDCGVTDVTTGQPESVYSYCDEDGEIMFEVCRFPGKKFRMRKVTRAGDYLYKVKGFPKLLYRLPHVLAANTVVVVEGEKDADTVQRLELVDVNDTKVVGTTNSGGVNKWRKEHTLPLTGKRVIAIGHNDERGIRHMDDVVDALASVASEVRRVHMPPHVKDLSEFMEGNTVHNLMALLPTEWLVQFASI